MTSLIANAIIVLLKMARKTKVQLQKEKIEEAYWDAILVEGKVPETVYGLCKSIEIKEAEFYDHYASLEAIESAFWASGVEETLAILEKDKDVAEYDVNQKLLAFFYTYFAHIQAHRSRFVKHFPCLLQNGLHCGVKQKSMETAFTSFAKELIQQGLAEGHIADRKGLMKLYPHALFQHFKVIIHYYIKDQSEQFQDTDAFIEKTVKLAIESMGSGVLDSAIDTVRFLLRNSVFAR